jgi:hypothetical protein
MELGQPKLTILNFKVPVRGNNVDSAGLNFHTVADRVRRHLGVFLQQLGQDTAVAGIQMRNHHKCYVGKLIGHGIEKRSDGVKPPGRGADADNGERFDFFLFLVDSLSFFAAGMPNRLLSKQG